MTSLIPDANRSGSSKPAQARRQQDSLYRALLRPLLRARFEQEIAEWVQHHPPDRSSRRAALLWVLAQRRVTNGVLEHSQRDARAIADWARQRSIEPGPNVLAQVIRALAERAGILSAQRHRGQRGRPAEKWSAVRRRALLLEFEYVRKRWPHLSKAQIAARLAKNEPGMTANAIRAQIAIGYKERVARGGPEPFDFGNAMATFQEIISDGGDKPFDLGNIYASVDEFGRKLTKPR